MSNILKIPKITPELIEKVVGCGTLVLLGGMALAGAGSLIRKTLDTVKQARLEQAHQTILAFEREAIVQAGPPTPTFAEDARKVIDMSIIDGILEDTEYAQKHLPDSAAAQQWDTQT